MALHLNSFSRFEVDLIRRSRVDRFVSPEALECRTDFEKFRKFVCGHDTPDHHRRWIGRLNTGEDSCCLKGIGGKNTLILSPRGSAKSTFVLEWIAWQIGVQTGEPFKLPLKVLYISYSIEIAMMKSKQIQDIVASDRYNEVFPWVLPNNAIWGMKQWDIDKVQADLPRLGEPYTLACAGMKGAVASRRAHIACFDDLLKSPDQIENPAIRERMENNWLNVIRPVLYDGARVVCLGTRMRSDDIYETTFNRERDWEVIEESAIVEDEETGEEKSYWPEFVSLEYLQFLREDDPPSFAMQYMNTIPKEGQGIIHPDFIKEGVPPDIDEFDTLAISSDFSASLKEKADYTVFHLWGKRGNEYWCLDQRRGRWSGNFDKCNVLLAMLIEWDLLDCETEFQVNHRSGHVTWADETPKIYQKGYYLHFFTEQQSYQVSFSSDWTSYVHNQLNLHCITCFPIHLRDKLQRLRGVTGVMQRGQVIFNRYRNLKKTKQELIGFGSTAKDDCADSFSLGLIGLGARPNIEIAAG